MNPQNDIAEKGKKHKLLKIVLIVLAAFAGVTVVAASTFGVLYIKGKNQLLNNSQSTDSNMDDTDEDDDGKVINHNGSTYVYNENITSVLFMGVDEDNIKTESKRHGESGQADVVYLVAIDTKTGKTDVVAISRDTMTDVAVYSKSGKYIGTEKMQLCLAYAYGDRRHKSCENVVQAVTRLMHGMPINSYFALALSGIDPLTRAVGGVEVAVFDQNNVQTGTKLVIGKDAREYLRDRDKYVLDSNNYRMGLQESFVRGFVSNAVERTKKDISTPLKLYDVIEEYSVTNINTSKITYLASTFISQGASVNFHTVKGNVTEGEHAEFNVDKDALYNLVLDVFYTKK